MCNVWHYHFLTCFKSFQPSALEDNVEMFLDEHIWSCFNMIQAQMSIMNIHHTIDWHCVDFACIIFLKVAETCDFLQQHSHPQWLIPTTESINYCKVYVDDSAYVLHMHRDILRAKMANVACILFHLKKRQAGIYKIHIWSYHILMLIPVGIYFLAETLNGYSEIFRCTLSQQSLFECRLIALLEIRSVQLSCVPYYSGL